MKVIFGAVILFLLTACGDYREVNYVPELALQNGVSIMKYQDRDGECYIATSRITSAPIAMQCRWKASRGYL